MEAFGFVIIALLAVLVFCVVMSWIQFGQQKRRSDMVAAVATTIIAGIGFWVAVTFWPLLLV